MDSAFSRTTSISSEDRNGIRVVKSSGFSKPAPVTLESLLRRSGFVAVYEPHSHLPPLAPTCRMLPTERRYFPLSQKTPADRSAAWCFILCTGSDNRTSCNVTNVWTVALYHRVDSQPEETDDHRYSQFPEFDWVSIALETSVPMLTRGMHSSHRVTVR